VVRKGLEKTTLGDVAKEAGQPRSLVRYFAGNRAELVALLIDRLVKRSIDRLLELRAQCGRGARTQMIALLFEALFSDPVTNTIIVELWHMSYRSASLRNRLARTYEYAIAEMAKHLSRGEVDRTSPEFDAIFATFSLGLGAAVLKHFGVLPNDPAQLLRIAQRVAANASRQNNPREKRRGVKPHAPASRRNRVRITAHLLG